MRVRKVRIKAPPAELVRFFPDLGPEQIGILQQPARPGRFLARGRPPGRFIRLRFRQPLLNGRLERVQGGQGGEGVRLEENSHRRRCSAWIVVLVISLLSQHCTTGRLFERLGMREERRSPPLQSRLLISSWCVFSLQLSAPLLAASAPKASTISRGLELASMEAARGSDCLT
jgi:hypothetical protein